MNYRIKLFILSALAIYTMQVSGQGFLHADGKDIVDGNGENFIIRSIGTGNWLLMEGYMMGTCVNDGSHTGIRNKLIETMGVAKTDSFYRKWNQDHMSKRDVDSLAAWGFNTIRVAMHYKWMTLPIEDEPVPGEHTWFEAGFAQLDTLLSWCTANSMYLILDMHSTPGGQNAKGDISDYDPSLPSLWQSDANKSKLVALWYKLAERYKDEPWIGGYDLINETFWTLPNNNQALRELFERLTDTIRLVDQNHILFIEGNSYANDHNGLTPPWDNNLVYSFHKYGYFNDENSLDWITTPIRDAHNVPLWLGETGENSNTWYTNLVSVMEKNNVGWSMWPVKKMGINNPLRVVPNPEYEQLLAYWNGNGSALSEEEAFQAVLGFSEQHRIENCIIQYDVIDALFRQPYSTELKSRTYYTDDTIYAVEYPLGRNGYAYFDTDTASYYNAGFPASWNREYQYRNDGVDIQVSNDPEANNPYSVGYIDAGEWLVYPFHVDTPSKFDCIIRWASGHSSGGHIVFEADGNVCSREFKLPDTGGWSNWVSDTLKDLVLPAGDIKLKVRFTTTGMNLNFFRFTNPRPVTETEFTALFAESSVLGNDIHIHLSQDVTSEELNPESFTLFVSNKEVGIDSAYISKNSDRIIILESSQSIIYSQTIKLSYASNVVHSDEQDLANFEQMPVRNKFMKHFGIPGKIQAEDYLENEGFGLEDCSDAGGGKNIAWANPGDYLDYLVYVREAREYQVDFRVASAHSSSQVNMLYENDGEFEFLRAKYFSGTGGWQNWATQSSLVYLEKGKYIFRLQAGSGEFNLNWFQFKLPSGSEEEPAEQRIVIYPNPAKERVYIDFSTPTGSERSIELYNINGSLIWKERSTDSMHTISTFGYESGTYILRIIEEGLTSYHKIMIY